MSAQLEVVTSTSGVLATPAPDDRAPAQCNGDPDATILDGICWHRGWAHRPASQPIDRARCA